MLARVAWLTLLLAGLAHGADRLPLQRFEHRDARLGTFTPCPDCNLLFVSIDTLRPDHLGCYGYERPTSPTLDEFCRDALVFDNAFAHAPSTLPSHASMFTSWIPPHHGAKASGRKPLPTEALTLAEVLHATGWTTAAFTDSGQMSSRWQLDQGFEHYDQQSGNAYLMNSFSERVDEAVTWIEQQDGNRWFLMLHTYEVHHPYTPHENTLHLLMRSDPLLARSDPATVTTPIPIRMLGRLNNGRDRLTVPLLRDIVLNYDAEIRSMDTGFAQLLAWLRESGQYERTVIVFTSDHGEEFSEHKRVGWHSHTLYDELLRVPLVIRFPDGQGAGQRTSVTARGIDLMPTVLEALAVPDPGTLQGSSLVGRVAAGAAGHDPVLIAERDRWQEKHPKAIRTRRWKLYANQLFDLLVDPAEKIDFAARYPVVVASLEARLESRLTSTPPMASEAIELDPALREQLRSLGYIQ